MRSTEKSFYRFVVSRREWLALLRQKIDKNETQTKGVQLILTTAASINPTT
jgi:hypothetical protein